MNKTIIRHLSILLFLGFLPSCSLALQIYNSPERALKNYLVAIQENNTQRQQEFKCLKEVSVSDSYLSQIKKIIDWKIIEKTHKTYDSDPDSSYIEFLVKIKYLSSSNFSIVKTWKFVVWNSNELFESQKRFADDVNQVIKSSDQTINDAKKLLGDTSSPSPTPEPWIPERSEISSQLYCVTLTEPI
ncbi:hypothetical protein [Microcystis aeruginosa]|jgi:hypothetical protein|uniref:hypothetical protein n=1 Tax=Microcystis TaxID=1125 RepID=UPI0023314209|nr:hypothetical protein [Microcystis aeruginosa]MDB9507555.1 hypothetical protein [Microcystis aeruginosa CS-338/01]